MSPVHAEESKDAAHSQQLESPAPAAEGSPAPVTAEGDLAEKPKEKPKSTKPDPLYVTYVIIGTGTAAFSAANAIRERDPEAQVSPNFPLLSSRPLA